MSSFRSLFGEPWSRWVAFGTLFGAFGPPWSPKVSQRCPEGSQKAHGSDQKGEYFRPKSGFGCITRIPKKCKKKVPKKHLLERSSLYRKCLQSVAPAMLLEVSTWELVDFWVFLHTTLWLCLPYFWSFFTLQRPENDTCKPSKRSPEM